MGIPRRRILRKLILHRQNHMTLHLEFKPLTPPNIVRGFFLIETCGF
jgi:hypothetical protein